MQLLNKRYGAQIFLITLGAIFFIPSLGAFHLFDWDEINFAESSREMLVSGNFFQVQINYEPFMEKPPFFFWLQSASMALFGVNEFGARFPNAVFGILTLLVIFQIGKRLKNERFGLIWSLIYLGSFLPHLYYKSSIIDPVFNFFIFVSIYYLIRLVGSENQNKKTRYAIFSGALIGLAIITKGPVGLILVVLTFLVYWIWNRFKKVASVKHVILFAVATALVTSLWYGYEMIKHGPWFLVEFINYQIELFTGVGGAAAGHQQPFYYHFVVVLIGCFPISILALSRFRRNLEKDSFDFEHWMKILFWVVMILFSIVSTKIIHYSSMAYLPLSYLAAKQLWEWKALHNRTLKWVLAGLAFMGFLFSSILILIPIAGMYKEDLIIPLSNDKFMNEALKLDVSWGGWEYLFGILYALAVLFLILNLAKQKILKAITVFSVAMGICLIGISVFVVPKIEQFTQAPAIEFYKKATRKGRIRHYSSL